MAGLAVKQILRGGLLLLLLISHQAFALDHALLVGVADYPFLPRHLSLKGPINDVALMREVLLDKGYAPEHIDTLVSRSGEHTEPTRANIIAAFQAMTRKIKRGDSVFFYMAGHGSQQPQQGNESATWKEPDGVDEVFLPADVSQWTAGQASSIIPNALLDDEIGQWLDELVDAGANVWAVFDTCHAAGMARAATGSTTWRAIDSSVFGLPRSKKVRVPQKQAATLNRGLAGHPRSDGRILAFAARGNELTGEEWLPRGASLLMAKRHGVFTYHLAHAMRQAGLTTGHLRQHIDETYARENRLAPVPQWLGNPEALWP